jgi:protein-disulfide isomerase
VEEASHVNETRHSCLLLLVLVLSVAACQANTAPEPGNESADAAIVEADPPAEVETSEVVEEEVEGAVAQDSALPSAGAQPQEATAPGFVPPRPVTLAAGPEAVAWAIGDPDAPVQIIEFTDYECPFCQRYALETLPAGVENLVEAGRVFYAIKDLPLDTIHPEARSASVAARCAGEQDAYLPMHDAIFAAQAEWRAAGDGAEAAEGQTNVKKPRRWA